MEACRSHVVGGTEISLIRSRSGRFQIAAERTRRAVFTHANVIYIACVCRERNARIRSVRDGSFAFYVRIFRLVIHGHSRGVRRTRSGVLIIKVISAARHGSEIDILIVVGSSDLYFRAILVHITDCRTRTRIVPTRVSGGIAIDILGKVESRLAGGFFIPTRKQISVRFGRRGYGHTVVVSNGLRVYFGSSRSAVIVESKHRAVPVAACGHGTRCGYILIGGHRIHVGSVLCGKGGISRYRPGGLSFAVRYFFVAFIPTDKGIPFFCGYGESRGGIEYCVIFGLVESSALSVESYFIGIGFKFRRKIYKTGRVFREGFAGSDGSAVPAYYGIARYRRGRRGHGFQRDSRQGVYRGRAVQTVDGYFYFVFFIYVENVVFRLRSVSVGYHYIEKVTAFA